MNSQDSSINAIPLLETWADRLIASVEKSIPSLQCSTSDHFGFMAAYYVVKQYTHLVSVRTLGNSRDGCLIARSMVEGLIQLKWVERSPSERVILWRAHGWICDWVDLQNDPDRFDESEKAEIEIHYSEHEERFRKNKHRQSTSPTSDAYHETWRCGRTLYDMCDDALKPLYDTAYSGFSDWSHWGTRSLSGSLLRRGSHISFDPSPQEYVAMTLASGIQCLIQTVEVAHEALGGERFCEFAALANKYVEEVSVGRE